LKTFVSLALAAALIAAATAPIPASAAEITFKLDDSTQNAVLQLPALLDQCVAGVTMRGDATVCKSISTFLQSVGVEIRKEQIARAAADKAAADEAAKAKEKDKDKAVTPPSVPPALSPGQHVTNDAAKPVANDPAK
jgi:hypothetical protein